MRPSGEYVQPNVKQVEQQLERFIERYHTSVFLVTEDGNIYDDLRNKFGEYIKIVSYDSFIYDYDGKDVLSRSNVLKMTKKTSWTKIPSKNDSAFQM